MDTSSTIPTSKKKRRLGFFSVLLYIITGIFVLSAIFVVIVTLCGGKVYVLSSGSMAPVYPTGTVVVTKKVPFEELNVGDIISFERIGVMDGIVTHRIVRVDTSHQLVFTKGDANEVEDVATMPYSNIVGKVQFGIPYIGYPLLWMQDLLQRPLFEGCAVTGVN